MRRGALPSIVEPPLFLSPDNTSSRVVMGLVHCTIVDSDSDSEIEAYPENCGA